MDEPILTHEHQFDGAPEKGVAQVCVDRKCTELRVGTGHEWRELTKMEANIIAQTGVIA